MLEVGALRIEVARPYYEAVGGAAGNVPVLAYHYPDVSPPGIPVTSLVDLAVAGCKDSSGSADRLLAELDAWDLPLYVGSSALLALAGPLGCAGAIAALANAEPERCVAAFAGDVLTQREMADAHRRAMANLMPESIRMARRKVGFNSPMPEWLNGPLAGWTADLLDRNVPAFAELVDEAGLRAAVSRLTASKSWDWESVGRIWPYLNMKWMLARYA